MSISGAATGLFSDWNVKADLEDSRNVEIDQAIVAVLQTHAVEMAHLYLDDNLPKPFERVLEVAWAIAGCPDDATFVGRYRIALAVLLKN
jgi:hypothetical protein